MGATVLQFDYAGGWPKKRQWALDTFAWQTEWILLLDADEILTERVKQEITEAISSPNALDGYWLCYRIVFLGRELRFGDTALWKLSLFRRGKGRYERRLAEQDASMSDIEVHEHIVVDGRVGRIRASIRHENVNSLHRYIQKHNEYSTWEAAVYLNGEDTGARSKLLGSQAERRRWLKRRLLMLPGSSCLAALYFYVFRLGFLDGREGMIHALLWFIQVCHIKAKVFELQACRRARGYRQDRPHAPRIE